MSVDHRAWFLVESGDERAIRLFCLPFAGGSAAAYARWRTLVDPRVALVPVQLPGRGARIREEPVERMDHLADMLADALEPHLTAPFALFGHSMGAQLAFETARTLRRRGRPAPRALFLSGRRAPQRPSARTPLHVLTDDELKSELRKLGGTPAAVLADDELLDLMLPVVRADLKAVETHAYTPEPPFECPIHAFGGTRDAVSTDDLAAWSTHTTGPFALTMLEGGHFFINEHHPRMLAVMGETLCETLAR